MRVCLPQGEEDIATGHIFVFLFAMQNFVGVRYQNFQQIEFT